MINADFYTAPDGQTVAGQVIHQRAYEMSKYRAAMTARFHEQTVSLAAPLGPITWTPSDSNGGAALFAGCV